MRRILDVDGNEYDLVDSNGEGLYVLREASTDDPAFCSVCEGFGHTSERRHIKVGDFEVGITVCPFPQENPPPDHAGPETTGTDIAGQEG